MSAYRTLLLSIVVLTITHTLAGVRTDLEAGLDPLEPRPLFEFGAAPDAVGEVGGRARGVDHAIAIDTTALAADRPELLIPTLDGEARRFVRTALELRGGGDFTWRGELRLSKNQLGSATLTQHSGLLQGVIFTPEGQTLELVSTRRGSVLRELDTNQLPNCAPHTPRAPRVLAPVVEESTLARDSADQIDILVVYTEAARSQRGGTSAIQALAQNAVDVTNTAYANSSINTRLRLVHTQEISYTESGDGYADLEWARNSRGVKNLRDVYRADVVSMIVASADNICGVSYLIHQNVASPADAYSVVVADCAAANLTLAHEVGHNQGCEHNPEDLWDLSGAYIYSYGHFYDGLYRTVMAEETICSQGCPRAPYFSNPAVSYQGQPTGIADQRDNSRSINNTADAVANFRRAGTEMSAPSNLVKYWNTRKTITIGWVDNSVGETGFNVYMQTKTGYSLVATTAHSVTQATVEGLKRGRRYTFYVTAFNSTEESPGSNTVTTRTRR